MEYGARNKLVGTVTGIKKGNVMSQVDFTVPADAAMSSVLTVDALEGLRIKEGDKVRVVIKAVNVLLIKE